jgi:hypothetical protein
VRQGEIERIAEGSRAHRREIGQIHGEQLPTDATRRVGREKMNAGYHRIRGHDAGMPVRHVE